jgi:hypothetical protein
MTTNYDAVAEQYKRSKQQPWRAQAAAFTLMRLIGDPSGKTVIDVSEAPPPPICGASTGFDAMTPTGEARPVPSAKS